MRWSCSAVLVALLGCEDSGGDDDQPQPDPPGFVRLDQVALGDEVGAAVVQAGDEILVGAPGDDGLPDADGVDPAGFERAGAVVILDAASLAATGELRAPTPRRGARFGAAIAAFGDLLAVGAPGDFDPDPEAPIRDATGAVYVFTRQGTDWVPLGDPIVPDGIGVGDQFGYSVNLLGDRLLVGAPGDDRAGDSAGGLWAFTRSGDQFIPGS
jgi:hypothetical protein